MLIQDFEAGLDTLMLKGEVVYALITVIWRLETEDGFECKTSLGYTVSPGQPWLYRKEDPVSKCKK